MGALGEQKTQHKLISVIVPVYNAEKWLHRCIDSIIAQTMFSDIELILVDDGSTDKSADIINEYSEMYENIRCIHIENGGVSNARNVGMDNSTGIFIAFVDADDYVNTDFISNLYDAMDDGCDICGSGFIAEYPGNSVRRHADKKYCFNNEEAVHQYLISGVLDPNVTDKLFRRSVIGDRKFSRDIIIGEDRLFLYECIKSAKNVRLIPVADYHYVMNDLSACRKEFSPAKLGTVAVAEYICEDIKTIYPEHAELAESMAIDIKCGVYGEMYSTNVYGKYKREYLSLKSSITDFSIKKKYKLSSRKHFAAFTLARIHPALYCFVKDNLKLQYK